MFNKDSAVVKSWKRCIQAGLYSVEDVPELGNLVEAVKAALKE